MANSNPLGFLQTDIQNSADTCNGQNAYADLTPAAWTNDNDQESYETIPNNCVEQNDYSTRLNGMEDKSNYSYLDLSRAVYEAAQNLEIVEDDCDEERECGEQFNHSDLVKKMGNTLGFTCYKLKYSNNESRNSYLQKRDAYDQEEGRNKKNAAAIQRMSGIRKYNLDNLRRNSKGWANKRSQKSDESSDTNSEGSTDSTEKSNHRSRSEKTSKDTDSTSIADFTVDDEELKTFANRRISQIRNSMLGGYDSDTMSEKSVDLDDLGHRAQNLLNIVGSKGRSLSMHNIHQAAKRS